MIRKTVYRDCVIITWLAVIGITLVNLGYYSSPQPIISPAFANVEYKLPELAPVKEQSQVKSLISRIWGKDSRIGLKIARAESGYRANAKNFNVNGTVDEGVFQINSVHKMPDMENPTANVLYAYQMYQQQGTNPWISSKKGWSE